VSSPLAIIGLTWTPAGGSAHDLAETDLHIIFDGTEGFDDLPDYRGADAIIPFRAGQLAGQRIPHTRQVVATGYVLGADRPTFRAYVDSLKGWLDPAAGEGLLSAVFEDGSTRWITCRPVDLVPGQGGVPSAMQPFSISWLAVSDPMWHADWGAWMLNAGLFLNDGLYLNEGTSVVITPTASPFDAAAFTALGTTNVDDVAVEIDGPTTGALTVTNLTNGFAFTHPALAGGTTLVVDSGARTVLLDAVQARQNLTLAAANGAAYFRLAAGSNAIRVAGQPAEVRITFDRCYL
jgi:hypothetical protein